MNSATFCWLTPPEAISGTLGKGAFKARIYAGPPTWEQGKIFTKSAPAFQACITSVGVRARGKPQRSPFWQCGQGLAELVAAGDIELLDGRAVVQECEQLDLGGPQIHFRGLYVGDELDALELEPGKVHAGDVARLETIGAHLQDAVVIRQALASDGKGRLGLENLNKCVPQVEEKISLQVGLLGLRDRGGLLRAHIPQLALVLPFPQVAETR